MRMLLTDEDAPDYIKVPASPEELADAALHVQCRPEELMHIAVGHLPECAQARAYHDWFIVQPGASECPTDGMWIAFGLVHPVDFIRMFGAGSIQVAMDGLRRTGKPVHFSLSFSVRQWGDSNPVHGARR